MLDNGDLAEVTWEQRETEGDPRYDESQGLPAFPFAGYAELLGLRGHPRRRPGRCRRRLEAGAVAADRPTVIEAVVDPDVPLLPPFPAGAEKLDSMRGGPRAGRRIRPART